MTPLQSIELRVLQLLPTLNLRPTLERSAEVGRLLTEAQEVVPRGQWAAWLRRVGLSERTARTHKQVFRHLGMRPATAGMTIEQFLAYLRQSRIAGKRAERQEARDAAATRLGTLPDSIALHHADCRGFQWPRGVACVATDPPWADMESYRWLAGMAADCLAESGVLLLQCGTRFLPDVLAMMTGAGLTYQWTFAIAYAESRRAKPVAGRYLSAWKPLLLLTKGTLSASSDYLGDLYLLKQSEDQKQHHDWQQSEKVWSYYLQRLVRPGGLVLDPFAGSGTSGACCRALGLRWIGTEVDRTAYEVARGRLLGEVA